MFTPWGHSQHVYPKGDGVLVVDTAGHGGVFVPDELLHLIPEDEQAYAARWSHSRNWYEEDCAAASPYKHLPQLAVDASRQDMLNNWYKSLREYIAEFKAKGELT